MVVGLGSALSAHAGAPVALVYRGKGSCDDGECSKAIAKIARLAGYSVRYVDPEMIADEKTYKDAAIWVQPGGDAIEAAKAIGQGNLKILAERIADALNYIGICAGAFLADSTVDDPETIGGLGLIPFSSYDYPTGSPAPKILPIYWARSIRYMYFEGGPSFKITSQDYSHYDVHPIASYKDGALAAFSTHYGRANVVLSATHPEATQEWLDEEKLKDPDGIDSDLGIELFDRATR